MTFVTHEELISEEVELLPARETLALFNWASITATNVALATSSGWHSGAWASANQTVLVFQH
jgi:hypothetical protein